MKFIATLLCALLLSGCVITTHDMFESQKECINKGGVEQIEVGYLSNGVLCKDGSFWTLEKD